MSEPSCHACGGPIAIGDPVTLYHPACDGLHAEALANARADVAHTMADLARVTAERDDLIAELARAVREIEAYESNTSRSLQRRLLAQLGPWPAPSREPMIGAPGTLGRRIPLAPDDDGQ